VCAGSIENKESKEEESKEEMGSEILDKRISELIDRVESLQKEIEDLSGPIQQLLKDIRISIYEIENPFSYVSQVAHRRPEEINFKEEKSEPEQLKKEKEPPSNHLLKTINLMSQLLKTINQMSQYLDKEDIQKILNLLMEADFRSPELKDLLEEVLQRL